jgi:hypothetical protein
MTSSSTSLLGSGLKAFSAGSGELADWQNAADGSTADSRLSEARLADAFWGLQLPVLSQAYTRPKDWMR